MDADSIFSIPSPHSSSPPPADDIDIDVEEQEAAGSVAADHSIRSASDGNASDDIDLPASDEHMEEDEVPPSPKSVTSDLSDKAFGEYMEAKIGLRTDGSGWMGEGEARAMRRGPVLFEDAPSECRG
jgi:hypothetical protein